MEDNRKNRHAELVSASHKSDMRHVCEPPARGIPIRRVADGMTWATLRLQLHDLLGQSLPFQL